ncbi:hypothetical protein P691DRAFT_773717 [Macrolepiota fuliginosa MF-IS2]|uniref:Uncharacterized protein n=1 Tax=Macrolepiota fuliginosa MF-IS2 TaxID=1400762 RepID=A0A9P5XG03_9AGAR|nr:hypothetical protein P691DRAFT_773717 [Macrolepiota fuliginosa MF-IS2]
MGIFGKKPPPPPKKTYEQVFADLVKSLCEDANKNLSNPISLPAQPTLNELEQIFKQITYDHFQKTFKYQFNATSTTPPGLAPGTRVLAIFDEFYKVDDDNKNVIPPPSSSTTKGTSNNPTDPPFTPIPDDRQPLSQILDDFKSRVTGLPDWVQGKAQNQIVGRLETVFNENGVPNQWTSDTGTPTLEQSDKYANSVRLDYYFIKLYGSLTETDVKAELNTVYCIGIYYQVISAAAIAKKELWRKLYAQAAQLLPTPPPTPADPPASSLEALLIWYRDNKLFEADHGFPFNGTPDGLIDDLGRPAHLFLVADDDFSKLNQEVEQAIFSKIKLPAWAGGVIPDLQREIDVLLRSETSESGGWLPVKYDKAPSPPSKGDPTLLIKADFIYCTLVSPTRSDVTYRGLYFCGVFYTATSVKETIGQELITTVYKNALRLNPGDVGPHPDEPTRADLDAFLSRALDKNFRDEFRFAYEGDKTVPDDKEGNILYACKVDFDSKTSDDATVADAVNTIMSAFKFPWGDDEKDLRKSLTEDLALKVKRCLEADPITAPLNSWNSMNHDRQYSYADSSRNIPICRAIILYCNGSVAAQQGVIKRSFIYFVGVLYEIKDDGGGW